MLRFFKLLEKYYLKRYLNWFFIFYLGINALILLLEYLGHIDSYTKHPSELYKVYKKYLYITFPIVIYFSIAFFFSDLKKNKEDIVIQSLGINFLKVLKGVIFFIIFIIFLSSYQAKIYGYSYPKIFLLFIFSYISMIWGILISQDKDFSYIILGFVLIFSVFNIFSSMINYHVVSLKTLVAFGIALFVLSLIYFYKHQKEKGFI